MTIIGLTGLFASTGLAQIIIGSDGDVKNILRLDFQSRDLAEEYANILDNLLDVLEDFDDYLEGMQSSKSDHRLGQVKTLQRKLRKGSYTDATESLMDDIDAAIGEIKAIERQHRVDHNTNRPRCCRLSRNLRKELIVLSELIEDYVDQRATQVINREDMKKYVEGSLIYLQSLENFEKLHHNQEMTEVELDALREALSKLEIMGIDLSIQEAIEATRLALEAMPELTVLPRIPPPEARRVPPTPEAPAIIFHPQKGHRIGARHESKGMVTVRDRSLPLEIENRSGDIVITSGAQDVITANLVLEVAASSHTKEKDYLKKATLAIGQDGSRYFVTVDLPRMRDARTELLSSTLTIAVPSMDNLNCRNRFGRVTITDYVGDVTVEGESSYIELREIDGNVNVVNRSGPVTLFDIKGKVEVKTSYAPIDISRCSGNMFLRNKYSSITMANNTGRLEIENTGLIELSHHEGDIYIENAYGVVEIDDVNGKAIIKNGYQPIIISDITGTVDLENEYAEISAEKIGGSLRAINNHGPIYIENLNGPIDLNNHGGDINVMLSQGFLGGSSITSRDGKVVISFAKQPDLILSIHTRGGSISSSLPISVQTRGEAKSARLVLGDGGRLLDLSGSNSAIVIHGQ